MNRPGRSEPAHRRWHAGPAGLAGPRGGPAATSYQVDFRAR